MRCSRCGFENREGVRFCEECGGKLEQACPACGTAVPPGRKFCGGCGQALVTSGSAATRAVRSPESYTPRHLAEKILTSKAALEGERKQVTVLFADLKGSMELLADRDPEEARRLLDPVLERMMEAVHHYEGTVNQVMGDGIMALFGAPIGHEDHAVRACYAALRMQRRISLYADEIQRAGGTPVQIRVGLNSGEVVVRAIGSDLHMDYTAIGQTTHLAARMEQMAKPGSTLVTGETLKLAEGYVQVRPLGAVTVKGLEAPTQVYELDGIVQARSRLQATAARGLTRFVGRDSEVQQLAQALERAAAGHGQAVAIVGEAGVGKSRLVWEFTRSHRTHRWLVLESGSVSYGKATPYLPVIELLKAYCRIQERDDPRAIRERMAGKLLMLDRALEPLLAPLLALLDVPVEDAAWAALDPPQRRQRTLDAIRRLLLRESQVQPLLLIFEDLHWIDAETQALLDGLMESLPTARILLLVNYRPEYEHRWGSKTYYTQLRLDPLAPESADELLQALLGGDASLRSLKALLIERTEGNPFFLEECVRTLVETGALAGERGAFRLAKPLPGVKMPATVQAVLAARIDRLSPEDKTFLQTASVIGKDVPFTLLDSIADTSEADLRRGLAHLQAAELLYETRLFPEVEYTFKHALTHEVAYGSLLQERRQTLHARTTTAIERLYADRLAEHVEQLAHHALRGEVWDKAVTYLRKAGAKATRLPSYREAVGYFEEALRALRHLTESDATVEQAIDLRLDLRNALVPSAGIRRTPGLLQEAETLAAAAGDRRRLARILSYQMEWYYHSGDPARARECGERALSLARTLGDADALVTATRHLGRVHHIVGDYRGAIGILRDLVASLHGPAQREFFGSPPLASVSARTYLALSLAEVGEFREAIAVAQEGEAIAQDVGQPLSRCIAAYGLGLVHIWKGGLAEAIAILERDLSLSRTIGPVWTTLVASALGSACVLAERLAEGIRLLEEAVTQAAAEQRLAEQSERVTRLGEGYLRAGRDDQAIRQADEGLRLARRHKERGNEAWTLRLLSEIAARRNPPAVEQAEARYRDAWALAQELGMRPLVAHCHLGLGKLYRRTGDRAKAEESLATAATMYREMDIRFYLAQAEAALAGPT